MKSILFINDWGDNPNERVFHIADYFSELKFNIFFIGRSYHNILTGYELIRDFLELTDVHLCLDVSHTYLSANHWGQDFDSYI